MSRKLVRRHPSVPFSFIQCGLTLPELVVSLAVVATLSTAGASSFTHFVSESQADTLMQTLRTSLMWARSEAIKRGQRVLLCRQAGTDDECAGSDSTGRVSWHQGWLMFVDQDRDRQFDPSKGDELLQVVQPMALTQQLMWNRGDYIAYDDSGALGSLNGTFCVGHNSGDLALQRELVLPHSGRLRTAAVACRYPLIY
ncbi:MAG: GspH/FimT family pseudopilin [Halopseudomonas sp.]